MASRVGRNPEQRAPTQASGEYGAKQNQRIGSIAVAGSGNRITIQQVHGAPAATSANPATRFSDTLSSGPTPYSVRKLMDVVLRTSSDFDAFCLDHFQDVARRFSEGMTRVARENLLLQIVDTEAILAALRLHDPATVERNKGILTFT